MEDENLEKSWTNCRIPFSILNSPGTGTMAVNDRRYGPVRTGYMWRSMTAATGRCEREAGGEPSLRPRRIENRIKAAQGRKSRNQNTRSVGRPGPQAGPAFFCVSAPWQAAPERWRPGGPAFPNQEIFFADR